MHIRLGLLLFLLLGLQVDAEAQIKRRVEKEGSSWRRLRRGTAGVRVQDVEGLEAEGLSS